jgi:hypothetical protein
MPASIKFNESTFKISNVPGFRAQPEKEFEHRLKTREHLTYLQTEKLFDVSGSRWAKKSIDGVMCYAHEYMGCLLIVRLKTADARFNLSHNEDGAFDRHLMDSPGEQIVYSITSANNGLESNHFFKAETIGLSSVGIICAALALTVNLANCMVAADAAIAASEAVATTFGVEATVFPGVGIAIAVLALIGVWIAYEIGREIMANLIFENRSTTRALTLVDQAFYNPDVSPPALPALLNHLHSDGFFEWYDDAVVDIDNYSKYKGIGVSLKFQKEDGSSLAICIRQDIYKDPHYTILALAKDDKTSAQQVYDNCTSGALVTEDFQWGDLLVKNRLDPQGFNQYKFAGIISFNDVA